jgi:hypothetical protein
MLSYLVHLEDVLPDGVDSAAINGKIVRKEAMAAFLTNVEISENPQSEFSITMEH